MVYDTTLVRSSLGPDPVVELSGSLWTPKNPLPHSPWLPPFELFLSTVYPGTSHLAGLPNVTTASLKMPHSYLCSTSPAHLKYHWLQETFWYPQPTFSHPQPPSSQSAPAFISCGWEFTRCLEKKKWCHTARLGFETFLMHVIMDNRSTPSVCPDFLGLKWTQYQYFMRLSWELHVFIFIRCSANQDRWMHRKYFRRGSTRPSNLS